MPPTLTTATIAGWINIHSEVYDHVATNLPPGMGGGGMPFPPRGGQPLPGMTGLPPIPPLSHTATSGKQNSW